MNDNKNSQTNAGGADESTASIERETDTSGPNGGSANGVDSAQTTSNSGVGFSIGSAVVSLGIVAYRYCYPKKPVPFVRMK